jgi:hypothetical protein
MSMTAGKQELVNEIGKALGSLIAQARRGQRLIPTKAEDMQTADLGRILGEIDDNVKDFEHFLNVLEYGEEEADSEAEREGE